MFFLMYEIKLENFVSGSPIKIFRTKNKEILPFYKKGSMSNFLPQDISNNLIFKIINLDCFAQMSSQRSYVQISNSKVQSPNTQCKKF